MGRGSLDSVANAEHIYEYFVKVKSANDSTHEIPAGMTAFQPLYPPKPASSTNLSNAETITVSPTEWDPPSSISKYSLEITFPHGRILPQHSVHNLSAILHRTGPTNETDTILSVGLNYNARQIPEAAAYVVAFAYDYDPNSPESNSERDTEPLEDENRIARQKMEEIRSLCNFQQKQLKSDPHVCKEECKQEMKAHYEKHSSQFPFVMPPAPIDTTEVGASCVSGSANHDDDEKKANMAISSEDDHELVTTSHSINLTLTIPFDAVPDFFSTFQRFQSEISASIRLHVESKDEASISFDGGRGSFEGEFGDPTVQLPLNANPVIRKRHNRILSVNFPIAVRPLETLSHSTRPFHYMEHPEDARAPVFIEPTSVEELKRKTWEERDVLAPKVDARLVLRDGKDIRLRRYFQSEDDSWERVYIGDKWKKENSREYVW